MLPKKTYKEKISINTFSTDGVYVSSVDYQISTDTKRDILNTLTTIRTNPLIEQCQIDGSKIWSNIKLYDSTIDDNERKDEDFRSDIQRIIIKKSGYIVFKAYSKWSDAFLTFEIEEIE